MPAPRLFDVPSLPREQWMHVLATVAGLTEAATRTALLRELAGDDTPDAAGAQVSERRPLPAGDGTTVVADIVVRSGKEWGVAVQGCLGLDIDRTDAWTALHDALAAQVEHATLVVVTPDRAVPDDVARAQEGRRIRHRSWQRVRDWVQERTERGKVTGTDAFILREADYFFGPRVAELYRLEELLVRTDGAARVAVASLFADLNDISPQPTVVNTSTTAGEIRYPRSGDPVVTVTLGEGSPAASVAGGPSVSLSSREAYIEGRSGFLEAARNALPARR
ncbi:MAG: hypothetical protein KDC33_11590 [Thermoleophilia bacterium]|nr:hypothetical protein [Thermoleophilia bacterium]